MADIEGLVLHEDVPKHRLMYVLAPHGEHRPLYPLTPATRPLRVGLDLSALGPEPPDIADFVSVLRRRPEDLHIPEPRLDELLIRSYFGW
ncbi:hypothetical protein [Nocardia abscessus]|uniref:hypothetical protein n=1 Tax=Nocardia abscessus TaxID=120957 RepID=UPI002453A035|nr:hypothetical protein [Nocardia abscessus]